jgi:hypothetical protein
MRSKHETEAPDGAHIIHKSSLFYWFGLLFYATYKFALQSQINSSRKAIPPIIEYRCSLPASGALATQFYIGIAREEHPDQSGVAGYRAQSPPKQEIQYFACILPIRLDYDGSKWSILRLKARINLS